LLSQALYLVHLSQRISSGARGEERAVRSGMDGDMVPPPETATLHVGGVTGIKALPDTRGSQGAM